MTAVIQITQASCRSIQTEVMQALCYHELMSWTIEQRWSHVLFVNWKVPASDLQDQVPFPLDLHEGEAVLSLVPFFMDRIRFRGLPHIPVGSSLWEINLRTYVKVNGVPGIYFFTLETPHRFANWIARNFFNLPYRHATVNAEATGSEYLIAAQGHDARGEPYGLKIQATSESESHSSDFQRWITERYHLFLVNDGVTVRGDVSHEPWRVRSVRILSMDGGISITPSLCPKEKLAPCFLAEPIRVRFEPFVKYS